jgi:hypothetical protein
MNIKQIEEHRSMPLGDYHLCTNGWSEGKLFHTAEQYAFGMATIALMTLKFGVKVCSFELMPNHVHMLLTGTGQQCLDCYYYLVKRINKKLKADGYPPLPPDYGFKLIPIEDDHSLRRHIIYLMRNKYEKGVCTPCGHMWGTGYLVYNQLAEVITGTRVKDMKVRWLERRIGSRIPLPEEWVVHPVLGILPSNYVDVRRILDLFPTVKDFMTAMVKDYESFVRISESTGETMEWSEPEVKDVLSRLCDVLFPQKRLYHLTPEEKCRLAVQADDKYHIPTHLLARILYISEYIIRQAINSKDYGFRKR